MVSANPPTSPVQPDADGRYGEVFDRGYQHYDGARLGRRHAVWALVIYSMKRAMGIKKSWTAKIIPFLIYVGAAMLAIIPVGIETFVDQEIISYSAFFTTIYVLMGVFIATIAPEMLCGDRRENVLALYFSRAITRLDYLLAKLGATALLTLTISLIPGFVLWLGRQLQADSPVAAMGDNFGDLLRIIVTGTLIALYLGAGGLMISSFTGRKAIAVAVIIIGFIVLEGLVAVLIFAAPNELGPYLLFLSPSNTVAGLAVQVFATGETVVEGVQLLPAWAFVAEMIGIVVIGCGVMYLRYVPGE